MTQAIWKTIPGHSFYEASNTGKVRSWNMSGQGTRRRKIPLVLKPGLNERGYSQVSLCANGKCKTYNIHSLVLQTFISSCPEGHECCHYDGVRTNNYLSNLRWGTRKDNAKDAIRHGTLVSLHFQGESNPRARLTKDAVVEIRQLYADGGVTYRELGDLFDVHSVTIGKIVRRERWAHIPEEHV